MRIKVRFVFPMDHDIADLFFAKINMPMKERKIKDTLRVIEVYKDTDDYIGVTEALKEFGVTCKPTETMEFNKVEMESAPLLRMIPKHHRAGYPQPEKGSKTNNYLSISFDFNTGCPYCTRGWLQNAPLHLRNDVKLGTADITGIWWLNEFIVSKKLREIIEQAKLSGCEFWPVVSHKTGEYFEDIFQLKITAELSPMAEETNIYRNDYFLGQPVCPAGCGELVVKGLAYYHSAVLQNLSDFALSNEWNGARGDRWRLPFVSQKTYRLFQKHKIKGVWYQPAIVLP